MGWGHGIVDGKHVGYAIRAKCEQPGCGKWIDRGLAFKCGGQIGSDAFFCNRFFCGDHLYLSARRHGGMLCQECSNDEARATHKRMPFPMAAKVVGK